MEYDRTLFQISHSNGKRILNVKNRIFLAINNTANSTVAGSVNSPRPPFGTIIVTPNLLLLF